MFTPAISAGFKTINILPETNSEMLGAAITLQNGNLLLLSEAYGSNGEVFMRQFTPDGRGLSTAVLWRWRLCPCGGDRQLLKRDRQRAALFRHRRSDRWLDQPRGRKRLPQRPYPGTRRWQVGGHLDGRKRDTALQPRLYRYLALTTAQVTGYGTDVLTNIENLLTGSGNDTLGGNNKANKLQSGAGNDILRGGGGDDFLYGGTGSDRLTGGVRRDLLYGGANDGATDVFIFTATTDSSNGAARDMIFDFVSGTDDIDLAGIDANAAVGGNPAFTWGGTTAAANAVWYTVSGTSVLLRGDVNGDGVFDFEIQVAGVNRLSVTDLLL